MAIEDDMLVAHKEKASRQGDASSGWVVLDYGLVLFICVHAVKYR